MIQQPHFSTWAVPFLIKIGIGRPCFKTWDIRGGSGAWCQGCWRRRGWWWGIGKYYTSHWCGRYCFKVTRVEWSRGKWWRCWRRFTILLKDDHGEDVLARLVGIFGMAHVRSGYIGGVIVSNEGICTEATGKNCGIYCNTPTIRIVYRGGADAGVQSEREVVGEVPHPGGMQQIQRRYGGWSRVTCSRFY